MDHVFHTILGQSPAPKSRPHGPEALAGALRSASSRTASPHIENAPGEHSSSEHRAQDTPHAPHGSGSNKSGAAATSLEAAIGGRDVHELSAAELAKLTELRQRDQEVRAHEQAHIAAGGGQVVGGANYTHTQGPDGRQYVVSGEVSIDASSVPGDPHATVEKAKTVRRAALAPAQPSGQDQAVAARARTMESEARMELNLQRRTDAHAAYQAAGSEDAPEANFTAMA